MIVPALVEEIKRLLAENRLSQRKIAVRLGVSRGTVHAISRGKRPDRPPREAEGPERPQGPLKRCPGCGGRVYMPCLLCQARAIRETQQTKPPPPAAGRPLGVIADDGLDSHRRAVPLDAALHY